MPRLSPSPAHVDSETHDPEPRPRHAVPCHATPCYVTIVCYAMPEPNLNQASKFYDLDQELAVFKMLSNYRIAPKMIGKGPGWRIEEWHYAVPDCVCVWHYAAACLWLAWWVWNCVYTHVWRHACVVTLFAEYGRVTSQSAANSSANTTQLPDTASYTSPHLNT